MPADRWNATGGRPRARTRQHPRPSSAPAELARLQLPVGRVQEWEEGLGHVPLRSPDRGSHPRLRSYRAGRTGLGNHWWLESAVLGPASAPAAWIRWHFPRSPGHGANSVGHRTVPTPTCDRRGPRPSRWRHPTKTSATAPGHRSQDRRHQSGAGHHVRDAMARAGTLPFHDPRSAADSDRPRLTSDCGGKDPRPCR